MDNNQIKTEITERWSAGAGKYDSYISHGVQTEDEKKLWIDAFTQALPKERKNLQILDIGCGTGAMGLILTEMGHTVTGLDLSDEMMEIGQKKAELHNLPMKFIFGDAEDPPFQDEQFDLVICRHLLWTLPHPKEALSSWKRIIRPGGRVCAIDGIWDDKKMSSRIRKTISRTMSEKLSPGSVERHEYSREIKEFLPHLGGVPEETARSYFEQNGLDQIFTINLQHIRRDQHTRLAWYEKIRPIGLYYLICGVKRE